MEENVKKIEDLVTKEANSKIIGEDKVIENKQHT